MSIEVNFLSKLTPPMPILTQEAQSSPVLEQAMRSLNEREEKTAKSLAEISAGYLKDKSSLPKDAQKLRSIAERLWGWTIHTRLAVWGGKQFLKTTRFWMMTLGKPSQRIRNQTDQSVNELSGSPDLAKAIHLFSPILAQWLQQQLSKGEWHDSINAFLKEEEYTLQLFLDILLPEMYVNIAKSIRDNSDKEPSEFPIGVIEVFAYICKLVTLHLPYINSRIENIEAIEDPIKRERKLCQLFTPLVKAFLLIAFPEGVKELPLTQLPFFSKYVWTSVQKRVLPLLFAGIYHQLAASEKKDTKGLLGALPGGESLVKFGEMIGQKGGEMLPKLFFNKEDEKFPQSPLIKMAIKNFCDELDLTDSMKDWLEGWLGEQLKELGKNEKLHHQGLWKLLGGYLEPLAIHILWHLSKFPEENSLDKSHLPDALGIVAIKLFVLMNQFFNAHRNFIEERLALLKDRGEEAERSTELLMLFAKLSEKLQESMGLLDPDQWPIPSFLSNIASQKLTEILPRFLLKQYIVLSTSKVDDSAIRKEMRRELFDPKKVQDVNVLTKVMSTLYARGKACKATMFEEFYQKLWTESGTERMAQILENVCAVLASDIVDGTMQRLGLASQEFFRDEANTFMRQTNAYLKSLVEAMLLESLVHIMKTTDELATPEESAHPKELLIYNIFVRLGGILEKNLKIVDQQAKESFLKTNNIEEVCEVLTQLAADIHELGGKNPLIYLPLDGFPNAENLRELLWQAVKEAFLPNLITAVYAQTTSWQNQLQHSLSQLEHCYHTTHPRWGCRVVAQYVSDFARNYLATSSNQAAELLLSTFQHYFKESNDVRGQKVILALRDHSTTLQLLFSKNMRYLGEMDDPQFSDLWGSLTHYVEATTAKIFAEISTAIQDIESKNPDLIMDLAILMLKETTEYFEIVNRVTAENGEEHGYKVNPFILLAAFGSRLHDGVPLNPEAPEEEKDRVRLEGHFIPLASKLLNLAGLTIDDFPIPSLFRRQLGELLITKILPLALLKTTQKVLEPSVRDELMLKFVQTLYAALNQVEQSQKDELPEEPKVKQDAKQKRLNETCGALVLSLVKLIPETMVQYVFMKEKVKSMSAETIGEAMMPYLSRWTLLQLIDTVFYHGLLSFHPSKWEGKLGREVLIPRRAFIRPDGKMQLKAVTHFKFIFPTTQAEIEGAKAAREQEARKTRLHLRDAFTRTISSQLRAKIWAFIKALWKTLQGHLDDFIEGQFPMRGPKVKAFLDKVGRRLFFDLLGSLIQFITAPFILMLQFFIEKTHINRRAEDIIENLHSEALENLVYKWMDTVIDTLTRLYATKNSRVPLKPTLRP